MYASCLFCNASLGRNESLEAFPVGRRLAFDAAKGRLWVVCSKCERWNLSPLDERWEAIEQAERLYRDTRTRVATENIGLAKVREGTTLVRIGSPMRPEFAAWRYGDQFGRRRQRQILLAGGGVVAVGALAVGGAVVGIGVGAFSFGFAQIGRAIVHGRAETIVAKIRAENGQVMHVRRRHLAETALTQGENGMAVNLRFKNGSRQFDGAEARRIAAIIVPKVNRYGGDRKAVADAVQRIEQAGTADRFIDDLTKTAQSYRPARPTKGRWRNRDFTKQGLFAMPAPQRLALEMALHEEAERRALEGELTELERAWREAEEIGSISDDLLLPDDIRGSLDRLKKGSAS
jgi:hypothetical protein